MLEEIRSRLWNADVRADSYADNGKKYHAAVLEQCKLYVEMSDRISARRGLANTVFLTMNTTVFTVIGVSWRDRPNASAWLLLFPLVVLLGQCFAWFWLMRSYRQLNAAKYIVIGVLEERLPASPYWQGEWLALGEGKDRSKYVPLTDLENAWPSCSRPAIGGFLTVVAFS